MDIYSELSILNLFNNTVLIAEVKKHQGDGER